MSKATSRRTVTVGLELTTDAPSEALVDPRLWGKAVGVFKQKVEVGVIVLSSVSAEAPPQASKKKAPKKKAAKRRAKD